MQLWTSYNGNAIPNEVFSGCDPFSKFQILTLMTLKMKYISIACEMLIFVLLISLLIHKQLHCPIGSHLWEELGTWRIYPFQTLSCPSACVHKVIKTSNCHYTFKSLHVLHCTQTSSSQPPAIQNKAHHNTYYIVSCR